jgi:acetolactate synthase-1/2/3 large subunit
MTMLTGGEAVVRMLLDQGVDTLYALPGVQNDALYNALFDAGDAIRVIHTRHEQGAAYMALGAALSTGKPAVYNVVPGPGVLNTFAALATAFSTNAPVFCLTGQIKSPYIGRGLGLLHELPDQLGLMRGLTKWAARINAPAEVPSLISEAFVQMTTGRPRPVAVEVPPNVLETRAAVDLGAKRTAPPSPPIDPEAIAQAARLLANSKNPMIIVGGGALDASAEVQQLAELLQAPVVANRMGLGVLSSRHELSLRQADAHQLWAKVDVVLAVGTRLYEPLVQWGYDKQLSVIRIDIDATEHDRVVAPTVGLVARSDEALRELIPAVERLVSKRPSRREELAALRAEMARRMAYLEPQLSFVRVLREELPDDGFFVDEMTQVSYVARYAFPVYQPRTFVGVGYQGTLGWGFATALGVKAAHPDRAVLSVNGDGGLMFTIQELATAVQHKLNVVSIVFNDNAYGNVQRAQRHEYDNRVIASRLYNPDFVKLAESFGAQGLRATTPDELRIALRQGFAANVPTLIEVPVGEMPNPWPMLLNLPRVRPAL